MPIEFSYGYRVPFEPFWKMLNEHFKKRGIPETRWDEMRFKWVRTKGHKIPGTNKIYPIQGHAA